MGFSDDVTNAIAPQAGVNTGDTGQSILDKLKDFLDRMGSGHLGYLYNYWIQNPCCSVKSPSPIIGQGDIDQLKQFDSMGFGFMDGAAKGLDNLAKAGGALGKLSGGLSSSISGAWTDKAGQAAAEKFGDLQKASGDYQESVQAFAAALHSTWQTTRQAVVTLANFASDNNESSAVAGNGGLRFMNLYGTEDKWNVGDKSRDIDAIKSLLGRINPNTQTDDGSGNMVGGSNFTPQQLATPGTVMVDGSYDSSNTSVDSSGYGLNGEHLHSDQVIQQLNDFCRNYDACVRNFRAQIQATVTAIQNQMTTLQDTIKEKVLNTDPFGGLNVSSADVTPGGSQPSQPSQNGGTSSSNSGSHAGNNGGGGSSSGTSAASFTPPPPSPSMTGSAGGGGAGAGGAQAGAGAMPTIPPISTTGSTGTTTSGATGTGLPGSGTGLPGSGTGLPGSGYPGAGVPGSTPETLTVQSGGNTIGMSTPDSQGTMQLTVTDASGHPKTYDIGFGQGSGATGGAGLPGSPGQPGMPGATPMHTGVTGGPGTAMPAAGGFGPTGTPMDPSQLAGGAGVQHITPGPDGKAVIHDGNLTITASEPQGQGGPVQVTVDDGTGHTSTYTLGAGSPTGGTPTSPVGTYQPDGGTAPSAWLSPDAAQAHTAAAVTPGVGGAVSGHGGDASSLVGGHVGGGGGHAGGAGLAAMGGGSGTGISNVLSGAANHAAAAGAVSGVGDVGLAGTDVSQVPAPGGAGLAQGPGGGGQAAGGMPMMGGMGAMGGGGQGGDTERGASQWRTQGHLFDNVLDDSVAGNFSGVLGEETGDQGR